MVRRFSYEFIGTEPDFKNIHIMPAWGSEREPGFYYLVADAAQAAPLNFQEAKNQFGRDHAFEGACGTLLKHVEGMTHGVNDIAQYDVILIDEAQDLPQPFFELAYFAARPPKRIVWGYDELQNLSAFSMVGPEKLFGSHGDGEPRIQFTGNSPQKQDVILPVCYRNTPWALTTAHALGFGIYRKSGLVQYFDDESLWTEIGYEHVPGATVNPRDLAIRRSAKSTPPFFRSLIQPDDAVTTARFANKDAQYEWIAAQIASNIADDELALLRQIA
ncbi:MAG: hypothetical protein DI536_29105 [Archangium gephyra]|uniref:Uncharacterized protein n=1 Tax=Archangium gephyra TaxID=48 RepID=A0A2W5SVX4_9BACT|nr:MAG: hypothetical protein DI536_29105 [Archangium gephyra]